MAVFSMTFAAIVACGDGDVDGTIRLSDTTDRAMVRGAADAPRERTIRIAVAGVMSPSRTLDAYEQLVLYLQERLDIQVTIDQRSSYAETNELVRTGQADVAFVCSGAYLLEGQAFGMTLLLAPEVAGETTYHSLLIVPADSAADSLADLRGGSFAFSDPLSNSGRLVPEHALFRLGETPKSFFRHYEYTGSHDNSILAVTGRIVDGAAVDSLVYDYMVARNPEIARQTRVIARWGPYGIPPLVASPGLDHTTRNLLRATLLGMADNEEGRNALAQLGIDRFVRIDDSAYDSIRSMIGDLKRVRR